MLMMKKTQYSQDFFQNWTVNSMQSQLFCGYNKVILKVTGRIKTLRTANTVLKENKFKN